MRTINIGGMQIEDVQRLMHDIEVLKRLHPLNPQMVRVEEAVVDEEQMKIYVFTAHGVGMYITSNDVFVLQRSRVWVRWKISTKIVKLMRPAATTWQSR